MLRVCLGNIGITLGVSGIVIDFFQNATKTVYKIYPDPVFPTSNQPQTEIGFVELNVTGNTADNTADNTKNTSENTEIDIVDVFVAPEHRRKGYANALLTRIFADYKNAVFFLEVRISNTPAIKLYEKHGFKTVNIRKKYYSNPTEDAFLMTKTMSNEQ
jgi:ribosomal protein S18 acetylase RimI-like enzyme